MIHIERLMKRFGRQEILRGVSIEVARGEVAVLIGASGGGKSTVLRCVNGLETFDAGRVRIDTSELHPGPTFGLTTATLRQLRRRVGMVFQQFNLFPHMSVLENV